MKHNGFGINALCCLKTVLMYYTRIKVHLNAVNIVLFIPDTVKLLVIIYLFNKFLNYIIKKS